MFQTLLAFIGIGLTLVGLGIAILTSDKLETFLRITERHRYAIGWSVLLAGGFVSGCTIIIAGLRLFIRASREFKDFVSPKLLERFEYEFEDDPCNATEIKEVVSLGGSLLRRRSQVDEEFLLQRHRVNSGIIKCARKRRAAKKKLSGFCILYPVNKKCEALIEQGYIRGSSDIREEHICKTFEKAYSVYVSTVYGNDMPTKAFIVYLLKRNLKEILKKNKHLNYVYARPSTPDGYKLAKKFGLKPLFDNSELWRCKVKYS